MAFPLPVAVHPPVVCISFQPINSPTRHLPPISPEKTRLRFSHLDPHPHPLLPLRAMPISRLSFRWQRQTKGVCPSRRTLAPNSLLATYDPLPRPLQCTNSNRSYRTEFAGRISKIFFARPGPSSGQMSLSDQTTDREATALFSSPPPKMRQEPLRCSTAITGRQELSKSGPTGSLRISTGPTPLSLPPEAFILQVIQFSWSSGIVVLTTLRS